jgi:hypothetical protein
MLIRLTRAIFLVIERIKALCVIMKMVHDG